MRLKLRIQVVSITKVVGITLSMVRIPILLVAQHLPHPCILNWVVEVEQVVVPTELTQ